MGLFDFLKPDVEMLSKRGDVRGLLKALRYRPNASIRSRAAEGLGNVLQKRVLPEAFEPLLIALRDPDHYVRRAAASALRWFREDRAVMPLADALKAPENWQDASVVISVCNSLSSIGGTVAADAIVATFRQASRTSAKNEFGRPLADELTKVMTQFKEMPAILRIARDPDPRIRLCSMKPLREKAYNKEADAFEMLLNMLHDPDEQVRAGARSALSYPDYLTHPQFRERMLSVDDGELRAYVQTALSEIAGRSARQEQYERREAAKPDFVKAIERNLTSPTPGSIQTALTLARQHVAELPTDLIERFVQLHRQAAHASHNKYFTNYGFWAPLLSPIEELIRRIAELPEHHAALRAARAKVLADLADADPFEDSAHHIAGRDSLAATAKLIEGLIGG